MLDRIPVGIAHAVWAGGGIVLVALLAWLVYGQRPDLAGLAGMGPIVAGVVILNTCRRPARLTAENSRRTAAPAAAPETAGLV